MCDSGAFRTFLLVALCVVSIAACSTVSAPPQTCAIMEPPRDASLSQNPVANLHIYPKVAPYKFTGCRKAWWAEGDMLNELLVSVRYADGAVVAVEVHEPGKPPLFCEYEHPGEPKPDNPRACGPASRWK